MHTKTPEYTRVANHLLLEFKPNQPRFSKEQNPLAGYHESISELAKLVH